MEKLEVMLEQELDGGFCFPQVEGRGGSCEPQVGVMLTDDLATTTGKWGWIGR